MNCRRSIFGRRSTCLQLSLAGLLLALYGCQPSSQVRDAIAGIDPAEQIKADEFLKIAEAELVAESTRLSHAQWEQATNITPETTTAAAEANEKMIGLSVDLAKQSAGIDASKVDGNSARKLGILKTSISLPAPDDEAKRAELASIAARMEGDYGTGRYCPDGESAKCFELEDLEDVMDSSRDPEALLEAWQGWRIVAQPIRSDFQRFAELANEGAQGLGYADFGAMWRSKYDMEPDEFVAELDRLWQQVKPLYDALHCHVRAELHEQYGADVVSQDGPIPAHLLGNMWAQSWGNIFDLVGPPTSESDFDLTEALEGQGIDARGMVRIGEQFFTSLGMDPLPETFWQRSLFEKPDDRQVVCHASAWHIDFDQDVRLKMCIDINAEDFSTVHHELGHNYYQLAYRNQDFLYRDSANDGFHEAVGDTLALSITPAYLVELGLIDQEPPPEADLALLMRMALDKVAFLPFGLLVDQWRFKVFSGELGEDQYNQGWWQLREDYQGVVAPVERTEADFDPGAKYHVPANTSYTRYFLAHILQFQFHRELCEAAGFEGPLHRCSIYGNADAGKRLEEMMASGTSRPWGEALAALSGESGSAAMDATAILDYFAPLKSWLDEQNDGRVCGW